MNLVTAIALPGDKAGLRVLPFTTCRNKIHVDIVARFEQMLTKTRYFTTVMRLCNAD